MNKERELNFVFKCFGVIKQKKLKGSFMKLWVYNSRRQGREISSCSALNRLKMPPSFCMLSVQFDHWLRIQEWLVPWRSKLGIFIFFYNTWSYDSVDCHLCSEEWVNGRLEGQRSRSGHYYIHWWMRTRKSVPTVVFEKYSLLTEKIILTVNF